MPLLATTRERRASFLAVALVVPVVALVVGIVTLAVTDGSAGTGATPAGANVVVIRDFAFSPSPLTVRTGTTVTVTNDDGAAHTLTADDGSFDTGNLAGGAHGSVRLDTPGRYVYHCDIHNYMTGTIEVQG